MSNGFAETLPSWDGGPPPIDGAAAFGAVSALPSAASPSAVLGANPNLAAGFGANPTVFAAGAVDATHTLAATGREISTASFTITIDPSQLRYAGDVVAGIYGGAGAGVSSIALRSHQGRRRPNWPA